MYSCKTEGLYGVEFADFGGTEMSEVIECCCNHPNTSWHKIAYARSLLT